MHAVSRTILIVDDHAGFRRAARALLIAEGFEIVGEADHGRAALAAVERLRPGVVLLDIQLPDLDGFAVADAIAGEDDPPIVILVSSRDRSAYGPQLDAADVAGFIPKSRLTGAAIRAILG
jgi:DNA-binding NarL/FixJ family response regulator